MVGSSHFADISGRGHTNKYFRQKMDKGTHEFIQSELNLLSGEKNLALTQLYGVIPLAWAFASASILTFLEGKEATAPLSLAWIFGIYTIVCVVGAYYLFLMSILRRNKTRARNLRKKIYADMVSIKSIEPESNEGSQGISIFFLLFASMFPLSKVFLLVLAFATHEFSLLFGIFLGYAVVFQILFTIALVKELKTAKQHGTRFLT